MAMQPNLREHCLPADPIEGVFKVKEKKPLVLHGNEVVVEDGVGCMDNSLGATLDADTNLKGSKVCLGVSSSLFGHAFGRPSTKRFANSDWAMAAGFFESGKEITPTEIRRNGFRDFSCGERVDDACHGLKKHVSVVRGHAFPKVCCSGCGRASRGEGVKGGESGEDFGIGE